MSRQFKDKGRIEGLFVPVLMERGTSAWHSAAWKATSDGTRLLYIALKARYIPPKNNNPGNNGKIYLPTRRAAEELGYGKTKVIEGFRELIHYGFIVQMTDASWSGVAGHGRSPHYRLTELGHMNNTPSRDYLRWDGVLFEQRKRPNRLHTMNAKNRIAVARSDHVGRTLRPPVVARSDQSDAKLVARSDHVATPDRSHAPTVSRYTTWVARAGSVADASQPEAQPGDGLASYGVHEHDGRFDVTLDGELVGIGFSNEASAREWIDNAEKVRRWTGRND